MTKIILILLGLLGWVSNCMCSSTAQTDSLQFALTETQDPNQKALLTLEYLWQTKYNNLDKAIELTNIAKNTLEKQKDAEGVAIANSYLGGFYYLNNEYTTAINYLTEAELSFQKTRNYERLSRVYNNLGNAYGGIFDYNSAIFFYNKSLKIKEQHLKNSDISSNLVNIATIYYDQGEYEKCIQTNEEALIITLQKEDLRSTAIIYGNLGAAYERIGSYKKAINYDLKALDLFQNEVNNPIALIRTYSNLGTVYMSKDEIEIAEHYFRKSLEFNVKTNNKGQNAVTYNNLAELYRKQSKLGDAHTYALEAFHLAIESKNGEEELISLKILSDIENERENYQMAYSYYIKYIALSDSLIKLSDYHNTKLALTQNELAIEKIKREKDRSIQEVTDKKIQIWRSFGWILLFIVILWVITYILKINIGLSGISILNYFLTLFWISWVFLYLFVKSNLINTLGISIFSGILVSIIILGGAIHVLFTHLLSNRILRNE